MSPPASDLANVPDPSLLEQMEREIATKVESICSQRRGSADASTVDTLSNQQLDTADAGSSVTSSKGLIEVAADLVDNLLANDAGDTPTRERIAGVLANLLRDLSSREKALLFFGELRIEASVAAEELKTDVVSLRREGNEANTKLAIAVTEYHRSIDNDGAETQTPKLDKGSDLWHSKQEMKEQSVTEDGVAADYVTQATEALSRLDEGELERVFGGLGDDLLRLIAKVVVNSPSVADMLENENPGLGTAVRQMLAEGGKSLTRDELRKLQTFAANRLKEDGFDQRVKERAIADDIFPPARVLFPDRITSPADVDADTLTALFREKAENQTANAEPLPEELLAAIKDLSQAWRKHFRRVRYRGGEANVSPAGEQGLLFRTPGRERKSLGTSRFWPKLEF